jgi:hypothetical protein
MRQAWFSLFLAAVSGSVSGGCSALIDVAGTQCNADTECVSKGLGQSCVDHVCVGDAPATACSGTACYDGAAGGASLGMCIEDADCKSASEPRCMRGTCVSSGIADRWVCAPDVAPENPPDSVHYSFQVLEFVSRKPPAKIVVTACRGNDIACTDPVARFDDTDGTGMVQLDLPYNFLGFFQVQSDALTALSYLTKPLRADEHDRDLQVVAQSTLDLLSGVEGTAFEPGSGLVLVEAFDCAKMPAAGVHFEESKGTAHPFYIVNRVPNSQVNISVYDADNDVADGGFINVEPGFVTFTARLGISGPELGEFNANVRAGAVTFIDMYF